MNLEQAKDRLLKEKEITMEQLKAINEKCIELGMV